MPSTKDRGRPRYDDILTPAEWRVVEAVRHGMTSRVIAARCGISVDAVKFHVANAVAKIGLGSRAQLRQWTGVARATHLYVKEAAMVDPQPFGAIGQISRVVRDIAAATVWYRDVLGLKHLYSFGDLAFFDCAGIRLFLSRGDAVTQESIIYFKVDDIRASHAALQARGAVFVSAPHMVHRHADGTEEWMAFLQDNEGRNLAIMAQLKE